MVSTKFVACIALLFSVALAAPAGKSSRGRIINIVNDFVPVTVHQSETSGFAVQESEVGFGRLTRTGVSVTLGASAIMDFEITVTAIDAETLSSRDEAFIETLTEEEREQYEELKERYSGNLRMPFLEMLGLNLDEGVTREDVSELIRTQTDREDRTTAVEEMLESAVDTRIRITGTLEAQGVSFRPTVAFAFIRLARVDFEDGSSQLVVSNNPSDLAAATLEGDVQESTPERLNILTL